MTTKEQEPVRVIDILNLWGTSEFPSGATLHLPWRGGRGIFFINDPVAISGVDSKIAVSFLANTHVGAFVLETGLPSLITESGSYPFEAPAGVLRIETLAGKPDGHVFLANCWLFETA